MESRGQIKQSPWQRTAFIKVFCQHSCHSARVQHTGRSCGPSSVHYEVITALLWCPLPHPRSVVAVYCTARHNSRPQHDQDVHVVACGREQRLVREYCFQLRDHERAVREMGESTLRETLDGESGVLKGAIPLGAGRN